MATLQTTPRQAIEQLEATFGLPSYELAHVLAVSPRTLDRWRTDATYPQHDARERLAVLRALAVHLSETFRTFDAIHEWLNTASRYLGGFTPIEAVRAGRFDRVEAALEALDSGIFV